jgi:tetratricopeptide (TPR) repeat protein
MLASLFFTASLIIPFYAPAQELPADTFADYLFREGEYYRAITEYYRILHTDLDYPKRANLLRKVGLCYFKGADYDEYILFYKKYHDAFYPDSLLYSEMSLLLGKSYYHLNLYQKTISNLDSQQLSSQNHFYNDIQFLLGISYSRMYNWQNAIQKLQLINQSYSDSDSIIAENIIRSFQNFPNLSSRSPFLAGGLSAILPGAGYAYCHRWGTGVASILINGLLAWTFSDALKREQYGLATLTGFVGIGWYVGNIKGSVKAAKNYNSNIRDDFINSVLMRENFLEYIKN